MREGWLRSNELVEDVRRHPVDEGVLNGEHRVGGRSTGDDTGHAEARAGFGALDEGAMGVEDVDSAGSQDEHVGVRLSRRHEGGAAPVVASGEVAGELAEGTAGHPVEGGMLLQELPGLRQLDVHECIEARPGAGVQSHCPCGRWRS